MPRPANRKRGLRRTIAADLIVGLTVAISLVVLLLGFFYYRYYADVAEDELKARAARFTAEFSEDIAWPLFNFDIETARQLANTSLRSEIVTGIRISVEQTEVFNIWSNGKEGLFTLKKAVLWEGKPVGHLQMQFSTARLQLENKRLIKTVVSILVAVVVVMGLVVWLILKILLARPLKRLIQGIRAIGTGEYEKPLVPAAHADINTISDTINDMAARIKKRSQQLMESENKYRSIFENAAEGICQATVDGRFISVNPAMAHILGYDSPADLIQHIDDIGTQLYADPEKRNDLLQLHRGQEIVQGLETEFRHKNGGTVWVSITSRAVADENGRIRFFEAFVQDITHRKEMRMALEKAKAELEDRVRQRTSALNEKTTRLERLNRLFVDRELRMKELKAEIKALKQKASSLETRS